MKRHAIKTGQGKGNTHSAATRCRHMPQYICRVLCTVISTHCICTDACSPSCIRSVQVRSMQWTPLVVQSKRVSTRIRYGPPQKCRTMQGGDLGTQRVAHVATMLVGCSPLSENLMRTTLYNSFLASYTPLAEHFLLYLTTMNLSIFYRVRAHVYGLQR